MVKVKKNKMAFWLLVVIIVFSSGAIAYAAAIEKWWDLDSPLDHPRVWTGVLSINARVVDVSSLPAGVELGEPLTNNDVVVLATYTVSLSSTYRGTTVVRTFSGRAVYEDPDTGDIFNYFWLVADGNLITKAFTQFLHNEIFASGSDYPDLQNGRFTSAVDQPDARPWSNVGGIDGQAVTGYVPGEPLYSIVNIEIQTPAR